MAANKELDAGDSSSTAAIQEANQRVTAGLLALELMHEIRGPLEMVGYLVYLAEQEAHDSDKVREHMALAEEQVATISRIARHTLSLARVAQAAAPVDMVLLTEAALRIHQRTLETKKIHLVKDFSTDLTAHGQGGQLLQALSNLILNAIEALPESGTLSLRMRRRNGQVHVVVADNGHGIQEKHLKRVGEPFFTTKAESGNGLGLPLSQRIIEDHQGTMRIRSSVRPGRSGTVFRVSLPAHEIKGA